MVPPAIQKGRVCRNAQGFTLIELLVVMAVIALLATLTGPALLGVFKGSALSQGGQLVQDQLAFYRQYALANNCPVEVRLYKYIDPSVAGDTGHYRAMQGLAVASTFSNGTVTYTKSAIGKAVRLPSSIIIDAGQGNYSTQNLSELITACSKSTGGTSPGIQSSALATDPLLPVIGLNYSYAYFWFKQDGSTNFQVTVSNGAWIYFLTLHPVSAGDPATLTAAKNSNYYNIQVDPFNGHIYSYRP